jgi:hypothetical protein
MRNPFKGIDLDEFSLLKPIQNGTRNVDLPRHLVGTDISTQTIRAKPVANFFPLSRHHWDFPSLTAAYLVICILDWEKLSRHLASFVRVGTTAWRVAQPN